MGGFGQRCWLVPLGGGGGCGGVDGQGQDGKMFYTFFFFWV